MNEIAVIRQRADEGAAITEAIAATFPATVIDIHRWDQIRVERVDSNGQVTASLAGKPMDDLRAVFLLGAPHDGTQAPTRDALYLQLEREQALLAALHGCHHVRIVNRGAAMMWNRGPLEPAGQLRILSKIGWRIPSVTHAFDLETDEIRRLRDPDPDGAPQELLMIGLRRHARSRGHTPVAAFEPLIARTQLYMRDHGLDLCTLPVALLADGPVAFGLHLGATAEVPREDLLHLLREAAG